jgi:hypothetical protein
MWFSVMVLGMAACGGATTTTTTTTTTPTATAPTAVQAAGTDLSGLGFEVHQEPG